MNPQPQSTFLGFLAVIFAAANCMAWDALQFDADLARSVLLTNEGVANWASTRGGIAAALGHPSGSGWTLPQYDGTGVLFDSPGGIATPLSFDQSQTGLVSRVFIVADGAEAVPYATLLDAPCPLRLMPAYEGGAICFSTSSVLSSLSLGIDFAPGCLYSQGLHTYEVDFATPCPLNSLYVGGSPATPAWGREWGGSVREAVFLSLRATAADAAAVRAYLSKKWRTGRFSSSLPDEPARLRALGLKTGTLYETIFAIVVFHYHARRRFRH